MKNLVPTNLLHIAILVTDVQLTLSAALDSRFSRIRFIRPENTRLTSIRYKTCCVEMLSHWITHSQRQSGQRSENILTKTDFVGKTVTVFHND